MLLGDDEQQQQQSLNSFHCTPILINVHIRRDEYSEIVAAMTKTLHVNTPEQTISGVDINDIDDDDDDDGSVENKLSNKQELIEQLQAQLIHNQMRRIQPRDYSRILSESNTPAYWYKAPQKNCSVYFYDPKYQKYAQQQSNSPQRIKPNIQSISPPLLRSHERFINHSNIVQNNSVPFTPRTKYMLDLYHTAVNYHQQKQGFSRNSRHPMSSNGAQQNRSTPSRLQSIPTLPPIHISKKRNGQEYKLSNRNEKSYQSIITEARKKI